MGAHTEQAQRVESVSELQAPAVKNQAWRRSWPAHWGWAVAGSDHCSPGTLGAASAPALGLCLGLAPMVQGGRALLLPAPFSLPSSPLLPASLLLPRTLHSDCPAGRWTQPGLQVLSPCEHLPVAVAGATSVILRAQVAVGKDRMSPAWIRCFGRWPAGRQRNCQHSCPAHNRGWPQSSTEASPLVLDAAAWGPGPQIPPWG